MVIDSRGSLYRFLSSFSAQLSTVWFLPYKFQLPLPPRSILVAQDSEITVVFFIPFLCWYLLCVPRQKAGWIVGLILLIFHFSRITVLCCLFYNILKTFVSYICPVFYITVQLENWFSTNHSVTTGNARHPCVLICDSDIQHWVTFIFKTLIMVFKKAREVVLSRDCYILISPSKQTTLTVQSWSAKWGKVVLVACFIFLWNHCSFFL